MMTVKWVRRTNQLDIIRCAQKPTSILYMMSRCDCARNVCALSEWALPVENCRYRNTSNRPLVFVKGEKQFSWKLKILLFLHEDFFFFSNGGIFLAFSLRRDSFESEIQITLVWSLLWIFLDAKFGFFLFILSLSSAAQFCVSGMQELTNLSLYSVTGSCFMLTKVWCFDF